MMRTPRDLIKAIDDCSGCKPRSYSGRGMYGEQCVGVDLDDVGQLFVLGQQLAAIYDDLPKPMVDSMGRGIIAYWPRFGLSNEEARALNRRAAAEQEDEDDEEAAAEQGLTLEQYRCGHEWAINEESDRSYCLRCGADGDA